MPRDLRASHHAPGDAAPTPAHLGVLVDRIRAGDADAFEQVFRSLAPGLCAYLTGKLGAAEPAEEIVQDLFLAVWRNRGTLDIRGSLVSYLYTAARNRAFNHGRDRHAAERARGALLRDAEPDPRTAEDEVWESEIAAALRDAVDALPDRAKEVFVLSRRHGKTYAEIATLLGISPRSVEGAMGRALTRLRERLRHLIG